MTPTEMSLEPSLDIGVFGARGIPSTYSGYETFLTVLLPDLVSRGHSVTMYCRRGEVGPSDWYQGVRCVVLPSVRCKQLSTLTHGYVAATRAVRAGHDVLLAVNVANAGACLACRALGSQVVLNTDGQEWIRSKWGRAGRAVFLLSAHLSRWSATALVCDSAAMRDIYRSRFRVESTVIPYCWTDIIPAPIDRLGDFGVERRQYFVVAGRFVPENNIDAIADAYLATDHPYPLLVLGAANYRSPVSRRLAELQRADRRLVVAGHVEDRQSFALVLAESLGYIHGHSVGGINPSLIEAMGCGARIAALDTPFNREALGNAGDYFADVSVGLGPVLNQIASECAGLNDGRREQARIRACTDFSRKAVVDAYEGLLLRASGSPRSVTPMVTRWGDRG